MNFTDSPFEKMMKEIPPAPRPVSANKRKTIKYKRRRRRAHSSRVTSNG